MQVAPCSGPNELYTGEQERRDANGVASVILCESNALIFAVKMGFT